MKDIETVVSDNIQKLLKEYNLSHADLAKIVDVSVSTVGKWVLKKASPRMGAVQMISDHLHLPKSYILKEETYKLPTQQCDYTYFPSDISDGLTIIVDGKTELNTIMLSDVLLGRYVGDKSLIVLKVSGDSMDKTMPDGSIIAIKPLPIESLKNGDIVVFSTEHEYSVKYYYKHDDMLVFKPHSANSAHHEQHYTVDDNITIHGKVVTYIVNLD